MTLKEAINRILTSIGENPIASEPSDNVKNPTVSLILRSLQTTSRRLQVRGYWFNTRYVELVPNTFKHLIVPEGTINWVSDTGRTFLLNDKLQCAKTGSVYFEGIKETGKVTVEVPFEDLPLSFAELVVLKANADTYLNTYGVDDHYHALLSELVVAEEDFTADAVRFGKFNTRKKRAYHNIAAARYR